MNTKIAKHIYTVYSNVLLKSHAKNIFAEVFLSEALPAEQIRELSIQRLQRIVNYAYMHVPHYRKAINNEGLDYKSLIFPDDLEKLPILTKEIMRDNANLLESQERSKSFTCAKTSGSTGVPLKFKKDVRSFCYSQAAMYRGHSWYGLLLGDKEAMLWGIPISNKNRLITRAKDLLLNRFREKEYNLTDTILIDFYRQCLKRKPSYLMGYTSMVYQFAYFLKKKQIDGKKIGLQMVKCTSETIHAYQRDLIEETFGCKLASEYGAAETGLISFQCPQGNHHVMSDCCYVEIVKQGKHVKDGEFGKILVTDLHNFINPVIRYDIGDLATYSSQPCSCGRPFPLIENITGRASDIVMSTRGEPFHSIIFYYIMKDYTDRNGGIKQFKVYQIKTNLLMVDIVKNDKKEKFDTTSLTRAIKKRLGGDMEIQYVFKDRIEREKSGKMRDFVSNLNADNLLKNLY